MDKEIKNVTDGRQIIHGLDLSDEVLLHNLEIINAELGITDEDIENTTEDL